MADERARRRLAELRAGAAARRKLMPEYPDTPEERAERLELVRMMAPSQAEAMASIDEAANA